MPWKPRPRIRPSTAREFGCRRIRAESRRAAESGGEACDALEALALESDRAQRGMIRRERDSNPRCSFPHSGFQDHRHRPLGHPSASRILPGFARLQRLRRTRTVSVAGRVTPFYASGQGYRTGRSLPPAARRADTVLSPSGLITRPSFRRADGASACSHGLSASLRGAEFHHPDISGALLHVENDLVAR